jgi:hypothetical protein
MLYEDVVRASKNSLERVENLSRKVWKPLKGGLGKGLEKLGKLT